jgi:type IV secretory pathway TraG/TraD family ATPase VirD4
MESQIYYRPRDQDTAKYLEECLGRKSDYAYSQTVREGATDSEGRSEQGVPLLTAQEIKQLRDEEIIAFHANLPPFRAARMDWRHYPILTSRRAMPPPRLPMLPPLAGGLPPLAGKSNGLGYLEPDDG